MKTFIHYIKKPSVFIPILIVGVIVGWRLTIEEDLNIDIEEVTRRNVSEEVSGTARVAADEELKLSFEVSGVIQEVLVGEGGRVEAGQVLARLNTEIRRTEIDQARANLRAAEARLQELRAGLVSEDIEVAEARLRSAEISLQNAKDVLEDVIKTQDSLIRDAKETLLTTDLQARLLSEETSTTYSYEPPLISGTFTGLEFGEYVITLYRSQTESGYSFRFKTDLESDGAGRVSVSVPQRLGTKGLNILFPENFARDWNIEWLVEIPNPNSSRYPALKQAYESAQESRDRAVREAERRVRDAEAAYSAARAEFASATAGARSEQIEAQEALVEQAEIVLRAAETNLGKSTLRAPIAGKISVRILSIGEAVSPGVPVFSLVAGGVPHLSINVPEVDVANLGIGDRAEVKLDAFPREVFEAQVTHISPVASDREGVAAFKTRLDFKDFDERIRVGMTADVDILTSIREGVVAAPGRALIQRDGATYVRMIEDGFLVYREVERGLRGSDGWVEIVSGLEPGERIITYADESDLKKLEER